MISYAIVKKRSPISSKKNKKLIKQYKTKSMKRNMASSSATKTKHIKNKNSQSKNKQVIKKTVFLFQIPELKKIKKVCLKKHKQLAASLKKGVTNFKKDFQKQLKTLKKWQKKQSKRIDKSKKVFHKKSKVISKNIQQRVRSLLEVKKAYQKKLNQVKKKYKKAKVIQITKKKGLIFSGKFSWKEYFNNFLPEVVHEKIDKVQKAVRKQKRGRPQKSAKLTRRKKVANIFADFRTRIDQSLQSSFEKYPIKAFLSLFTTAFILISAWYGYDIFFRDLPSPLDLTRKEPIVTTKIYDRNGGLLFRVYEDENRTLISLSQVPKHMVNATVAIEDKEFYNHHGFSMRGITRALISNAQGKPIQGGSTITQQLVKNRLLSPERTVKRKLREILLSILVEGTYSKDEVLEMYLNTVAYGGSTYGVEEAAWRFFNKPARDLTLAESALLAGLPQSPSIYSPFGANPELAYARQDEVLRRMVKDGYITPDQRIEARNQELAFSQDIIDIRAPHFVMYVKKILAEKYGEEVLYNGGLEVRTTLDLNLQDEAQKIVTDEVNKLAKLRVNNGATLVTNPQTGEILAMVGSKDYFDFVNDGQVNVTLRPRQPGSSIKPLTYALAFERGQTPSTTIEDSAITYHVPGSKPYSPKNYDGKYHGRVTLRESLASSYNIPAVKTLAGIGVDNMIDKAEEMGITTWGDRKRFGLSLTLGGGEILMADMAKVYGAFANQGYSVDLNPFLEIKNYKGEVLYENKCALNKEDCTRTKVLEPKVAYQITDILSDNKARTPAFGAHSVLHIPNQQVAVKTGTTNNLRDNWTIGYSTDRLVAVWVGNNDNTSMSYVASGITGASPIWNEVMRLLLDDEKPHTFAVPDDLVKVKICAKTGTLPCRGCPVIREEVFVKGTEPKTACNPAYFRPKPKLTDQAQNENRDQILEGWRTE